MQEDEDSDGNDTTTIRTYLSEDLSWLARAQKAAQQDVRQGFHIRAGFYDAFKCATDWDEVLQREGSSNVLVIFRYYGRMSTPELFALSFLMQGLPTVLGARPRFAGDLPEYMSQLFFQPHWWLWEQGCTPITMCWNRGGGSAAPSRLPGMDWLA